jgi:hypothetical protein
MPDHRSPEQVTAHEILTPLEGKGGGLRLTPLQQIGARLALGVGSLIALVTVAVLIDEVCSSRGLPALPTNLASPEAKAALENYKFVHQMAFDRGINIFETIVAKALLPLFTAILGYIFGSSAHGRD